MKSGGSQFPAQRLHAALGTLFQRVVTYFLQHVEFVSTRAANVGIDWHQITPAFAIKRIRSQWLPHPGRTGSAVFGAFLV